MIHPWVEWNKELTAHTENLLSCPFCSQKHLSLNVGFEGKAARVTCRKCFANGPWALALETDDAIINARNAWNGLFRDSSQSK